MKLYMDLITKEAVEFEIEEPINKEYLKSVVNKIEGDLETGYLHGTIDTIINALDANGCVVTLVTTEDSPETKAEFEY
ncbi:MAG: hypothetical protein ACRCX8_19465 [Sarcina sp.]